MSAAWENQHRRWAVLRDVVDRLNATTDGVLPWDEVPAAASVFGTRDELLLALQRRWNVALGARIEALLETGAGDLAVEVGRAWQQLAADLPGLRRALDRYAEHPALHRAVQEERQQLAVAAGLASFDTPVRSAARAGAALVGSARSRAKLLDRLTGALRRPIPARPTPEGIAS